MRKKSMRLVSAALAACMAVSVLPVGAFALDVGAAPESSVSTQETAMYQLEGGETIDDDFVAQNGSSYSMSNAYTGDAGSYAAGITINTTKDVTITIDGPVDIVSGNLVKVDNAGTLTIENKNNYKVKTAAGTAGHMFLINKGTVVVDGGYYESQMYDGAQPFRVQGGNVTLKNVEAKTSANALVIDDNADAEVTISGGKYTEIKRKDHATVWQSNGTLTVQDGAKIINEGGNATILVRNGTCNLKSSTHTSGNYFTIRVQGGTCNIYDGEYRNGEEVSTTGYQTVYNTNAVLNIHGGTFEGPGYVIATGGTGTTTIDEKSEEPSRSGKTETVIRSTEGGRKYGIAGVGDSTTIIDGCTIENANYGIAVMGNADVTLKNAVLKDNKYDIALSAGKLITIEDTFTSIATVWVAESSISTPRQVTTNRAQNQNKLHLISSRVDANGRSYRVAYDAENNYRYLTPRTAGKFTVDAEDAKAVAEIDGVSTELDANTEIAKDTHVDLTAVAPGAGWEFIGWELKVDGNLKTDLLHDAGTENPYFVIPADMEAERVTVRALFNFVGTDDGAASASAGGAIAAVAVGAAAAWGVYEAGTGIYRMMNMRGIPLPSNRAELAMLIWERAGKPEPASTALYTDIDADNTDLQKAAHWMVEQGLMDEKANNTFKPNTHVTKVRVCTTWEKAKQKGLFDKTEE